METVWLVHSRFTVFTGHGPLQTKTPRSYVLSLKCFFHNCRRLREEASGALWELRERKRKVTCRLRQDKISKHEQFFRNVFQLPSDDYITQEKDTALNMIRATQSFISKRAVILTTIHISRAVDFTFISVLLRLKKSGVLIIFEIVGLQTIQMFMKPRILEIVKTHNKFCNKCFKQFLGYFCLMLQPAISPFIVASVSVRYLCKISFCCYGTFPF